MHLVILFALFLIAFINFQSKASNLSINKSHSMKELQSENKKYKFESFSYEYFPKNKSEELLDATSISLIASSKSEDKIKISEPLLKAVAQETTTHEENLNSVIQPIKSSEMKSKISGNINPYLAFSTSNSVKTFTSDNFSANINGKINLKIEKYINCIAYGANTQLSSPTVKNFVTADNNTLAFFTSSKYGKFSLGYQNGVEKSLGVDAIKLEAGRPITPRSSQFSDFYISPVLYSESIANTSNKYVLTNYNNKNFLTTTAARISFESPNIKGFKFGISYAPFGYNKNLFITKTSDEVQKLRRELLNANATIKEKSDALDEAIKEKNAAEQKYEQEQTEIARLTKERDKALEALEKTKDSLKKKEEDYAKLQVQEKQDQETILTEESKLLDIENQLSISEQNLKTAKESLTEKEAAYSELQDQEKRDMADLQKAVKALEEAQKNYTEAQKAKDEIEKQLTTTQNELAAANAAKAVTEADLAIAQNDLSEANKAKDLAENKAEEAKQKLDNYIKKEEEKKKEKQTIQKDLGWGITKNKSKNTYNYFTILDRRPEEIYNDIETDYNVQGTLKRLIHNNYDEFKIAYKNEKDYPLGYLIAKPSKAIIEISGETAKKKVFAPQLVEVYIEPVEIEAEIAIDGRVEKENTLPAFHDMIIKVLDKYVKGVKDIYFIPTSAEGDESKSNVYVIQMPELKVPQISIKPQDVKIKFSQNETGTISIRNHVFHDNIVGFRKLAQGDSNLNFSKVNVSSYLENSEYRNNPYEEDVVTNTKAELNSSNESVSSQISEDTIQLAHSEQLSEKELQKIFETLLQVTEKSFYTNTSTDENEKILFQGPNYKNIISGGISYNLTLKNNIKTKFSITGEYGQSIKHDQLTTKYDTYYEMHDLMAVATGFQAEFFNLSIGGSYGYLGKSGLIKQEYSLKNGDYISDNYSNKLVNTTYFTIGTGYKYYNFYSSLVYTNSKYQNNTFNNISVGGEYSLVQTNNINYTLYANYSFVYTNKESLEKKKYSNLATGIEISF